MVLNFSRCSWILDADGNVCPFLRNDFEAVMKNVLQPMSAAGLSTICLAFKNYVPGATCFESVNQNTILYNFEKNRVSVK